MKYSPKQLKDNVNVSKTHPLMEFSWLFGSLTLIAAVLFLIFGLATDLAVSKTPIEVEQWLGKQALRQFPSEKNKLLQTHLETLLTSLPENSPLHKYDYSVFLSPAKEINAIALPGGNIVIFSGLLKEIESENELAMVLYHELGHFAHRDHLRSLGRGLGLTVASVLFLGGNSTASELLSKTLLSFHARYSQKQEAAADRFGLELLHRHYGHVGGGTDFFLRLAKKSGGKLPYLLASHPHPQDRIVALNDHIAKNNFPVAQPTPLPLEIKRTAELERQK